MAEIPGTSSETITETVETSTPPPPPQQVSQRVKCLCCWHYYIDKPFHSMLADGARLHFSLGLVCGGVTEYLTKHRIATVNVGGFGWWSCVPTVFRCDGDLGVRWIQVCHWDPVVTDAIVTVSFHWCQNQNTPKCRLQVVVSIRLTGNECFQRDNWKLRLMYFRTWVRTWWRNIKASICGFEFGSDEVSSVR